MYTILIFSIVTITIDIALPGKISNSPGGATACKPCGTGSSVGAGEGKATCICDEGYYNDDDQFGIAIDSCIACPEGTFKEYPGSASCESCFPGSYNKNPGWPECTLADIGYFVQSYGSVEQTMCPEGFYSDAVGSPQCIPCPKGTSTIGAGSTSQSDCIVCPYGVNELFACRNETETLFLAKDICWSPTDILELDSSDFVIEDYVRSVLYLPYVGVLDVIRTTMEGIQLDADSELSSEDYFEYVQNIVLAYDTWLPALDENIPSCVDDLSRSDSDSAATAEPIATAIGDSVSGDYSFSVVDGMNFWSISGTGSENADTDEFYFLHSAETRERGIIVTTTIDSFEVEAATATATANDFAQGGILIRETLEQRPDSKFLSIFAGSDDGMVVQLRADSGTNAPSTVSLQFDIPLEEIGKCAGGWYCTGVASVYSNPSRSGVQVGSMQGTGFLDVGSDSSMGTATSDAFVLPEDTTAVKFLRAGGAEAGGLGVYNANDHKVICEKRDGTNSDDFFWNECDVTGFAGKLVYLYVWDCQGSSWGKTFIDDIHFVDSNGDETFRNSTITGTKIANSKTDDCEFNPVVIEAVYTPTPSVSDFVWKL